LKLEEFSLWFDTKLEEIHMAWTLLMENIKLKMSEVALWLNTKVTEIQTWATNAWNSIWLAFQTAFQAILNFATSVFQGVINWINNTITAVKNLIAALADIVLPDELQPGSPTPFEIGIRGITSAINELNRTALSDMRANLSMIGPGPLEMGGGPRSLAMEQAGAGSGGPMIVVNLTYAPALSASSRADVERMIPLIEEGVRRTMRNLNK
jgi:hypothetical protein